MGATTSTAMPRAQRHRHFQADKARAPDHDVPGVLARSTIARLSANERRYITWPPSAPGIGNRTGSAPVARSSAPNERPSHRRAGRYAAPNQSTPPGGRGASRFASRHRTRRARAESNRPAPRPPGNPSKIGTIDRRIRVGADHGERSVVASRRIRGRDTAAPPPTMTIEDGRADFSIAGACWALPSSPGQRCDRLAVDAPAGNRNRAPVRAAPRPCAG